MDEIIYYRKTHVNILNPNVSKHFYKLLIGKAHKENDACLWLQNWHNTSKFQSQSHNKSQTLGHL